MFSNKFVSIKLDGEAPLVAAAIHDGHNLSDELKQLSFLSESDRLREEDPHTGEWTSVTGNRIIANHSRFEFDLNRPPEKAVYLNPEDAWGLEVWKSRPSAVMVKSSLDNYREVYKVVHEVLTELIDRHGMIVVFDLHSYNHRRGGPHALPDDPLLNPEINIGTGTMDRDRWGRVVNRFMDDMSNFDFDGRHLDVRENIKFKGGYFPRWIHEQFPESACCISIEFKKFFMNEWTGEPDNTVINMIGEALKSSAVGVLEELSGLR